MHTQGWIRFVLVGLVSMGLALGACSKKKDDEDKDEKEEKAEKKDKKDDKARLGEPGARKVEPARPAAGAKARPAGPAVVMKIDKPGPAFFGVAGKGLVRLQGGKFTIVGGLRHSVRDVALGPDGSVWVISLGTVYRVKGDAAVKVGDYRKTGSANALAVGPNGHVWTVGYKGVGHYDGKGWTLEEKTKLGKVTLLKDVAVDSKGQVWVTSSYAVHTRKKDGSWMAHDTAKVCGAKAFFNSVAVGPNDMIYVSFLRGIARFQNGAWTKPFPMRRRVSHLAVAPDGKVFAVTGLATVREFDAGGAAGRKITPASAGFKAGYVRGISADAAGRVWLGTDHGIVIVQPKGGAVQWEPGTVRETAGRINAIYVAGKGPNLPKVGPKITGSVKGKVLRAGAGVGNADIQICESPSMIFRTTPCGKAPFYRSGKTDGEGNFLFTSVPAGTYRFAIKVGKKWRVTLGGDCCANMKQGQTYDVGSIRLRK